MDELLDAISKNLLDYAIFNAQIITIIFLYFYVRDTKKIAKMIDQGWEIKSSFTEDNVSYTMLEREEYVRQPERLTENERRKYEGRPVRMQNVHPDDPDYTTAGYRRQKKKCFSHRDNY